MQNDMGTKPRSFEEMDEGRFAPMLNNMETKHPLVANTSSARV